MYRPDATKKISDLFFNLSMISGRREKSLHRSKTNTFTWNV